MSTIPQRNWLPTHLIVDQAPLLEKSMNAHDSAHVSGQIAPTSCDSKIFRRSESVGVDHKVAIVLVNRRCLGPIPRVEELGQSSLSGLADKEDPNLGSESLRMTATGVYVFANSNSFTCLISF